MPKKLLFLFFVVCSGLLFSANLPAPSAPCQQKNIGDPCTYGYGCSNNGTCQADPNCKEDPNSKMRRCVICKTR